MTWKPRCCAASRSSARPAYQMKVIGFRVVLEFPGGILSHGQHGTRPLACGLQPPASSL